MKINIVSSIDSFKQIQNNWTELFNLAKYSVFQSFEFNYYSWKLDLSKNSLNRLCVVLLTSNEKVYTIIPLYIDSKKRLRFINDNHADFCDFLSVKSIDLSQVINSLKEKVNFKFIRLINVRKDAGIYTSIKAFNSANKIVKSISEYSVLNLEQGIFPYNVPHYRSHQKHRINKAIRKHEDKTSLVFNYKEHSFPKKEILLLKEVMINSGIRKHDFLTNEMLCLIEHLYNSGFLILHMMMDKDRISACNIILTRSSNGFMFWIDLFDNLQMINISSYICFMQYVSLEKAIVIDFGRGRYFYKSSNFNPEYHKLHQIDIFFNKWDKVICVMFNQIRGMLISIYKKIKI